MPIDYRIQAVNQIPVCLFIRYGVHRLYLHLTIGTNEIISIQC